MANLSDSDLLLVNRSNKSYKVTGAELKDYYVKQPTISSVVLTEKEDLGTDRFNDQSFISTVTSDPGRPPAEMSIRGIVNAQVIDNLETSSITNVGTASGIWNPVGSANGVEASEWHSVTYGDRKFVAVAYNGTNRVMYSSDGINWTSTNNGVEANGWNGVTYGDGKFVAVASAGGNRAMYSSDGISWTAAGTGNGVPKITWRNVTYGNGKFVAVGVGYAMYSSNGINWTSTTSVVAGSDWRSVTYGDGKFVAVAASGSYRAMYSSDGINWTLGTTVSNNWQSVTYGNGKFVAVSTNGADQAMYSSDGINWTETRNGVELNGWYGVTYGGGKFVAVAQNNSNRVMYSSDGINWTSTSSGVEANDWYAVTYADGKFVAVSRNGTNRAMWSITGGPDETQLTFTDNKDLALFQGGEDVDQSDGAASGKVAWTNAINNTMLLSKSTGTWANGQTVIGPPRPLTTSEITGVNPIAGGWTPIGSGNGVVTAGYTTIAYGGGKFVAIPGSTNQFIHSDDGITWTAGSITSAAWQEVTYGDGKFVVAGNGLMAYSANGTSWTDTTDGVENAQWRGVAYGDGKFVAVTNGGGKKAQYSTDGVKWTNISTADDSSRWYSITYGGGKFVAVGNISSTPKVMYSDDGINWEMGTVGSGFTGTAFASNSVTYGNGRFVAVASTPTTGQYCAMYSDDGINWTPSNALQLSGYRAVAYGGGQFVALTNQGNLSTIYSADGITWYSTNEGVQTPNAWSAVAYGAGKFVAVAGSGTDRVMYSLTGGGPADLLTFTDSKNLDLFEVGDPVKQDNDAATGYAGSIDVSAKTIQVVQSAGTWSANTDNFVIGPNRASTKEVQMFCKLNNSLEVIDLQETNPGYTKYTGTTPTIKFPYYLPNGEPVDSTLLPGSSIYTQVKADNLATPEVTKKSNTVTPASTCLAGPITTAPIVSVGTLSGDWTSAGISGINAGSNFMDVTYADDRFVAVAQTNVVMTSLDGINWTETTSGVENSQWTGVTYGNGRWVACAKSGTYQMMYSDDGGATWTKTNSGVDPYDYEDICFGHDQTTDVFVAVASGRIQRSPNGKSWSYSNSGIGASWLKGVVYAEGKFVAVANGGAYNVLTSLDTYTWVGNTNVPKSGWCSIAYGNGIFVAVASSASAGLPKVMYSTDGAQTWAWNVTGVADSSWKSVTYGDGRFVAVGSNGSGEDVIYSTDGRNWTPTDAANPFIWEGVAYGAGKFVAVCSNNSPAVMYSLTGGPDLPQLTFENPTGLSELNNGDAVVQENAAASGSAALIDVAGPTLAVSGSSGTWAVGQRVTGPNRVCPPLPFDASDPADVAQFEAIKASFEGYETSKKLHRASLISRMLLAGFTEQQISTFDLDTADVALNINGYYPLYTTEVLADAAGNGASHAHEIDGVTYYMPDGGVPIYHGNYNEPEDTTSDSTDSGSTDTTDSDDSGSSSSGGGYGY